MKKVISIIMIYKQFYMIGNKNNPALLRQGFVGQAFTLIEIIIAVAIFAVLILAANRIFQSSINAQKTGNSSVETEDAMSYFLEVFSREVRGAQKSTGTCAVPAGSYFSSSDGYDLIFKNINGSCIKYYSQSNVGYHSLVIERDDGTTLDLASSKMDVIKLIFDFDNGSTTTQAVATVNLKAKPINGEDSEAITAQTSVSVRDYNW